MPFPPFLCFHNLLILHLQMTTMVFLHFVQQQSGVIVKLLAFFCPVVSMTGHGSDCVMVWSRVRGTPRLGTPPHMGQAEPCHGPKPRPPSLRCCAVLCCAVLCYAMLCYAMLCYAMMCHDVPCCAVPMLFCAVLCCAVLCRAAVCMLFSCCHHDCRLPVWCVHDHSDIVAPAKLALTSSDCCCLMTCRSSSRTAWRALYATQMLVS